MQIDLTSEHIANVFKETDNVLYDEILEKTEIPSWNPDQPSVKMLQLRGGGADLLIIDELFKHSPIAWCQYHGAKIYERIAAAPNRRWIWSRVTRHYSTTLIRQHHFWCHDREAWLDSPRLPMQQWSDLLVCLDCFHPTRNNMVLFSSCDVNTAQTKLYICYIRVVVNIYVFFSCFKRFQCKHACMTAKR